MTPAPNLLERVRKTAALRKVEKLFGSDWREVLLEHDRSGPRTIAAVLIIYLDEVEASPILSRYRASKSSGLCHAKKIVREAVVEGNLEPLEKVLRNALAEGDEGWDICTVGRAIGKSKALPSQIRETDKVLQYAEALRVFISLLSPEALSKAWRFQAAQFSTDRPGQGDTDKAAKLNQVWSIIEKHFEEKKL